MVSARRQQGHNHTELSQEKEGSAGNPPTAAICHTGTSDRSFIQLARFDHTALGY